MPTTPLTEDEVASVKEELRAAFVAMQAVRLRIEAILEDLLDDENGGDS